MHAIEIPRSGPPEVLRYVERPDPHPAAGEVVVRVAFAGMNFADILARMGLYPGAPKRPYTPGFEVSGTVSTMGDGVDASLHERRVIALNASGGYATHFVLSADRCIPIPDDMPFEDAAALPVIYLTAWALLQPSAHLTSGETVVIHGAGGGVGTAAIQIVKHLGGRIIGTASTWKHERLRALGVDLAIDPQRDDFATAVKQFTNGRGADVILDPIGGGKLRENYRALAKLGRLIVYGSSSVAPGLSPQKLIALWQFLRTPRFHPLLLMADNKSVAGLHLGRLWDREDVMREGTTQLLSWYREGVIKPVIDRIFPLAEAAAAHRYVQERKNFGKVLLEARE